MAEAIDKKALEKEIDHFREVFSAVEKEIARVIVGNREIVRGTLSVIFAGGHALLEGVPGLGKTLLVKSVARALGLSFKRIQFTPDLMPSDVTGTEVLTEDDAGRRRFIFKPGSVFANVVLADEINRATPRTQAALLEAMQEKQVTVDGETRPLPRPFLVLATQNPIEYEGTFPLPEAQLDRFLLRLPVGYPGYQDERTLLVNLRRQHPIENLQPVEGQDGLSRLLEFQKQAWEIHVDETLQDYIVRLVQATRKHNDLALGCSPRASLALLKASQAWAGIHGREHVIPDDIKFLAPFALAHRLIARPESELRGRSAQVILKEILAEVPLKIELNG